MAESTHTPTYRILGGIQPGGESKTRAIVVDHDPQRSLSWPLDYQPLLLDVPPAIPGLDLSECDPATTDHATAGD
ncbi:hypothetical protein ACFC58_06805 [Kitasatospora purpeofusca]|uniref:hypothetical protein n=1 Tax=Kitasatospora purpeofusca TaxID=67352 RepID=UPI0035DCCD31